MKVDDQIAGGECQLRTCWAPRNELEFPDTYSHPDLLPNTSDKHLSSAPAFNTPRTFLTFWNKKANSYILGFPDTPFWLNTYKEMSKHFTFLWKNFISLPTHAHVGFVSFCSHKSSHNQCAAPFHLLFACSGPVFIPNTILGYSPTSPILSNSRTDVQDLCHFIGSRSLPDNIQTRGMTSQGIYFSFWV